MKKYTYILVFLLFTVTVQSQSFDQEKDLKVGVVLSGGGAKGFAHIGALKIIEEAGIRVDFVGGTSMGSIVGALYAAGDSADEIEKISKEMKFENFMDEGIPRRSKPFFQKENEHKYIVKLSLEDKKIKFPQGLMTGNSFLNEFSKYTQHINNIEDFNKFPIPFYCIATDLEKGEQVLLNKGYLPNTVRASASFPSLLRPVMLDGKMLVDGGVFNNFPIDEMKDLGADLIIGIDVGEGKLKTKEEINSVLDVLSQISSYPMYSKKNMEKKDKVQVYIRPNISEYSVVSFDKFDEIVTLGYNTAFVHLNELKKIAQKQKATRKEYHVPILPEEFIVNSINITGNEDYTENYIIEKLQVKKGEKVSFKKLFNGIDRLYATDNFTNIAHKLVLTEDLTACDLTIEVIENPVKTFLQVGLHYDALFKAGVLLNITKKHLFFDNDMMSADIIIGEKPRYNFTYFVDNGFYLSYGFKSLLQNFEFDADFKIDDTSFDPLINYLNLDYLEVSNRFYAQAVYKENYAIRLGVEHLYKKVMTKNLQDNDGDNKVFFEKSNYGNVYGTIKFDTYDQISFPKKGIQFETHAKWHLLSSDYQNNFNHFLQGRIRFGYAQSFGKRFTTQIESEAGYTFGDNKNPFLDHHLGGNNKNHFNNYSTFYGYTFAGFGNSSYLKTALHLRYELFKNNFLSAIANVGQAEKDIFGSDNFFENTKTGYALQYGIKSIAGPVTFTYSYSPEIKSSTWNINIGYWF